MFATTDGQSLIDPLKDRMKRVCLQDYDLDELGKIVLLGLSDYEIDADALLEVATVLRGNARAAQKMAVDIKTYLDGNDKKKFTIEDWEKLQMEAQILPLGLLGDELAILKVLSRKSETRLMELAAVTMQSKKALQDDLEPFLMKKELITIVPTGRSLTAKGRQYLIDNKDTIELGW